MTAPLDVYASVLAAGGRPGAPLRARLRDGMLLDLAPERWLGRLTVADESVLDRATGPVIDLGCGPGRHLHGLARRGVYAVGVDISPVAVALARGRGARAMEASIFGDLPGVGSWRTALLLDGNLGIGGDPSALLARIRRLLAPAGEVMAELEPPGTAGGPAEARLETDGEVSDWFAWARVGAEDAGALASASGFRLAERWSCNEREFMRLRAR